MSQFANHPSRMGRALTRWHALRASRMRAPTPGYTSAPEPRAIGNVARGRRLLSGDLHPTAGGAGDKARSIWDASFATGDRHADPHGFLWLDDLAAVGDRAACKLAQRWLADWIARYGKGRGPGWTPAVTGRRLLRWIFHAEFLARRLDPGAETAIHHSLFGQAHFLDRRWHASPPGASRIEALTGLVHAALALEDLDEMLRPSVASLARECAAQVAMDGTVQSRNPEDLADLLILLSWTTAGLSEAGVRPPAALVQASKRLAPVLRAVRHADGGLARFHGGGRGAPGEIDQALAQARIKQIQGHQDPAMGFARLTGGRCSLLIDAGPPPRGEAAATAHASTLAFELTSGRRPLVTNCGSGVSFGTDWWRAGRATPSHSTLSLDGFSSARLGPSRSTGSAERLIDGPGDMPVQITRTKQAWQFEGAHDGYLGTHGLTHARKLALHLDGRALDGEDTMLAIEAPARQRFVEAQKGKPDSAIGFHLRFHLHPAVSVSGHAEKDGVSLTLGNGEVWVFRQEGGQSLRVEPSVYLETGFPEPLASNQIVVSGRAVSYATRVRWSLSKTRDTASVTRDLRADAFEPT